MGKNSDTGEQTEKKQKDGIKDKNKKPQKEKKSEFEDVKKKFRNDDLCLKFLDDQVFCFDYAKISETTAKERGMAFPSISYCSYDFSYLSLY